MRPPELRTAVVNITVASRLASKRARRQILRMWGLDIGEHVSLEHGCSFQSPEIQIGDRTYFNHGVTVGTRCRIGSHCAVGMETLIITGHHEIGQATGRAGEQSILPVRIGDGCWIGARVTILPGVTIGDGCVIAAGALVRSDCEPHCLYAGAPAVFKRRLPM
jgi:maltose O-acetyltransferase